jgi:hypothetical protein
MAFCNSCGSMIDAGARFCPKCGKPSSTAAAPTQAVVPPPSLMAPAPVSAGQPVQATGGSNALKIILIVVAVVVGLGILGVGTAAFLIHRAVSRTHIESRDGNVKVHTPFGNVESTTDPDEAARNLGVDVYPGASVVKDSAANLTFGKTHTAAAEFETSDSPKNVAEFYRSKFPTATFMSSEADHFSLVAGGKENVTTINVEPREGKTRISISRMSGKAGD